MYVIAQAAPSAAAIPSVAHATWAGHDEGVNQISIWRQTLEPGAATPPHRHECDEVVLCQAGFGELHVDGEVHRFGPGSTLILPRGRDHQIFNTGEVPMETMGVFGASPVITYLPDGQVLDLPWRS
ncbi:cupin domain-containing protein [Variovorax sp. YR216]|uniref:cupin domain-containing protein n=1 Tax=Variovorax sp. YR216 TaxID=1882828 RepID=UPI000898BC84|nr:cupin domain-containing protein [Variovorax sp. YR216]SEA16585.1 Cupin domain-containing protein [Variovorax sp. YR216]